MMPTDFCDEINSTCNLKLRPVAPDDLPFLLRLYRSTREMELSLVPWDEHQKDAFIQMQFDAQTGHYKREYPESTHSVIVAGDLSVGRLYIDFSSGDVELLDLIVKEESRNKGLGYCIVRAVQNEAERSNKRIVIYLTAQDRALPFFERLGFKPVDDSQFHIKFEWASAVPATS